MVKSGLGKIQDYIIGFIKLSLVIVPLRSIGVILLVVKCLDVMKIFDLIFK